MPYPTRSSTKIIKNVVCRVLVVISLLLSLVSCEKEQDKVEDGVSLELAKERKANIGGVTYKLYFSIPADRSEAIMAESTIFFELFDLIPVILDFKEAKENILAVTSSDGRKIPYTFKNEHIIIHPEHLKKGRNELVIQFKAGESSLNRSDDMLYTLLVPDRCRTLMPCFDQPDIKARFKLTLKVPSRWISSRCLSIIGFDSFLLFWIRCGPPGRCSAVPRPRGTPRGCGWPGPDSSGGCGPASRGLPASGR